MADRIRLLPDSVSNQIAAGEVVNRPASVIKELMENSVDAGAKSITVNFRDGGKELIQIVDDGCGMSPNDARMAFDRHATSKITKVDDIYALSTFGFRGEALASIAAVSEVELRTRPCDAELGIVVEIGGGTFKNQSVAPMSPGTQFLIRNLFYNVPARRRFLDKSTTESRHIATEFQRVALCHPEIAFKLYNNDAIVYDLSPGTLRQRIVGVIGKQIATNLLDIKADTSIVRLSGFVGRPAASKQTNRDQFLFVNGRYFDSPYFRKAVTLAYEKLIPANTQPAYFLYLEIDPERIDVNVHPQKTEVKFDDNNAVWQIINAAVRESLGKLGVVPMMDFDADASVEIPVYRPGTVYRSPEIAPNPDFNPFREDAASTGKKTSRMRASASEIMTEGSSFLAGLEGDFRQHSGEGSASGFDHADPCYPSREEIPAENGIDPSLMEFISGGDEEQTMFEIESVSFGPPLRIGKGYVAAAFNDSLAVIDLRRAFETVLYERYMQMQERNGGISQQLLFPETLELSIEDYGVVGQCRDDFAAFGFDLAFPDGPVVEVRGIPADFTSIPLGGLFAELLDALRDETVSPGELRRTRLAAIMAKNGARALSGNLSDEEITALLVSLTGCLHHCYTPGGNPVMTVITADEIKKRLR